MSRQFHGQATSKSGDVYVAELWNGSTPDSPDVSIELAITDFEFDYDKLTLPFGIMPSTCRVGFSSFKYSTNEWNAGVKTNLENIATSDEGIWVLKVTKNGSFWWAGRVLTDQIHFGLQGVTGFVMDVTAKDCLNLIDGYFVDSSWFSLNSSTRETGIVLLSHILGETDLLAYFDTDVIADGLQVTNASFPVLKKGKTLAFTNFQNGSFIDNFDPTVGSDEIKWIGCREALENILKSFGGRIMLSGGKYWVTQPDGYQTSSFDYTTFDSSGAENTYGATLSHRVANGTYPSRPCFEWLPDVSYQKPFRTVELQWDRYNYQRFSRTSAASTAFTGTTTDILTGHTLPGYPINVTFKVKFDYYSNGLKEAVFKIGTYVMAKNGSTYYYWNGAAWTSNASSVLWGYTDFEKPDGAGIHNYHTLSFTVAEPPSGYELAFGVKVIQKLKVLKWTFIRGYKWGSPTESDYEFTCDVFVSQAYNSSEPYEFKSPYKQKVNASSPYGNASTYFEYPIKYHDATSIKDTFGMMVWNGTSYVAPGSWSVSWHSDSGLITAVLAANIIGLYTVFLQTIEGTWHDSGSYQPVKSLYFDTSTYIFNGGRHTVISDSWQGMWIKIATDYTNYSSDGSGQRTVQKTADTIKDRANTHDAEIFELKNIIGNLSKAVLIPDIINTATGAPTTDPGVSKKYPVSLTYDYANSDFSYQIEELPQAAKTKAVLMKAANQTVNNSDTLADDNDLQFTMNASATYNINIRIYFDTDATADFKWGLSGPAAPTAVRGVARHFNPGGTTETVDNFVSYVPSDSITGSGTTGGWLWVNLIVQNGTNAGTFKFKWAQNTATVADTKVLAGSIIEFVSEAIAGAYSIAIAQGSYTVTGQDINFTLSLIMQIGQGSYALTGQDVAINKQISLPLAQGSYALTGQALGLTYNSGKFLDTYTGASVAWSLRQLKSGVTNCIRVRRSSDSTEQDIGFSGGVLDTTSLLSFCGSGDGYVVKWYDQSGNGNDLVQSTSAKQPQIVSAGSVITQNSLPSISFGGSAEMDFTTAVTPGGTYTIFNVQKRNSSGTLGMTIGNSSSLASPLGAVIYSDNNNYLQWVTSGSTGKYVSVAMNNNSFNLITAVALSTTSGQIWLNGTSQVNTSPSNFTASVATFNSMGNYGGSKGNGYESELILYTVDQTSSIAAMNTDIKTYYGL